jgi:GNAT superfamily N-acetyltransferase
MRVQVQRCTDEQLPAAAMLAADIQARTRKEEPLLPESYEDPAVVVKQLADRQDIWVATRGGEVVAVLAATPGGYGAYVGPLAVAGDPEALVGLYTAAAADWVAKGVLTHAVHIPSGAPELIDPFLRLGFGYQAQNGMHALKVIPAAPEVPGLTVSLAGVDDFEELLPLTRALPDHLAESPVFSPRTDNYYASLRDVHWGNVSKGEGNYFLARLDGRAVGLAKTEDAEIHPLEPVGGSYLGIGVVISEFRGTGVGLALTHAYLSHAAENGSTGMATDWRTTNLPAARFWPAVGFRPTCLRLSRQIDLTPR